MKKCLILILFFGCTCLLALSGVVKVTLKNGTTITGALKTMNTSGNLTLQVAGQDFAIPMSDVASIDELQTNTSNTQELKRESDHDTNSLKSGVYEILDHDVYPDSINVVIGGQEITMILVRGGYFNMGFDGRHSLSMNSEPIHRVNLSSFYISKQYLNGNAVNTILELNDYDNKIGNIGYDIYDGLEIIDIKELSTKPKPVSDWKNVQQILGKIGNYFRLPTEAEWEYCAITPVSKIIFSGEKKRHEWCSDYYGDYSEDEQTNPQGASEGKNHVARGYSKDNNKWRRYKASGDTFIRIAVDVDKINVNK